MQKPIKIYKKHFIQRKNKNKNKKKLYIAVKLSFPIFDHKIDEQKNKKKTKLLKLIVWHLFFVLFHLSLLLMQIYF